VGWWCAGGEIGVGEGKGGREITPKQPKKVAGSVSKGGGEKRDVNKKNDTEDIQKSAKHVEILGKGGGGLGGCKTPSSRKDAKSYAGKKR